MSRGEWWVLGLLCVAVMFVGGVVFSRRPPASPEPSLTIEAADAYYRHGYRDAQEGKPPQGVRR